MTIRVLLLDDSAICRAQLRDILEADDQIQVVAEAYNGDQVLRLIDEASPHILLVDLQMPGTGGQETIERVMAHQPLPILIVTGQPEGVRRQAVFEAIRRGALDLAEKPRHGDEKAEARLRAMVRELSRVRVVRHVAGKLSRRDGGPGLPTPVPPRPLDGSSSPLVVGVAASAGGPRPLVSVLGAWPADFPAAVLVVQHLPNGFTPAFAEFLQSRIALRVVIVKQVTRLEPGRVYLANDDEHLVALSDKQLGPDRSSAVDGHRPAATVMFESLAARLGARACGVILSGMGKDGVVGLAKMKARGALTLAQDEASCAVYGMPKAAIESGAVTAALEPVALAREVASWVSLRPSQPPGGR
ncbi:MAG TPA: chemotaxis protein CheB [Polyangiaceae bacterium]|nr:chemotaxis protein CheB [Polyangiaceae bacterium]